MTIPEAAQLVIQAGAMASGGEVFVLDMGDSVKIIELAHRMVELSGLSVRGEDNPDGDIEIVFVGLRPGEKLYEELLIGDNSVNTSHSRIIKASENYIPWSELSAKIEDLESVLLQGDARQIRDKLRQIVPSFSPDEKLVDFIFLEKPLSDSI